MITGPIKFLLLVAAFLVILSPARVFAQDSMGDMDSMDNMEATSGAVEKVDIYALFWPLVPGKTVNDSMFWAKQLKESIGTFFRIGDISKSQNQITLSEKRLVEANKLFEDKNYDDAGKTLNMNKTNRDSALDYLKKAKDEKKDVDELRIRLVSSLQNQENVAEYWRTQLPDDQKSKIEEMLKDLTLQISEAR